MLELSNTQLDILASLCERRGLREELLHLDDHLVNPLVLPVTCQSYERVAMPRFWTRLFCRMISQSATVIFRDFNAVDLMSSTGLAELKRASSPYVMQYWQIFQMFALGPSRLPELFNVVMIKLVSPPTRDVGSPLISHMLVLWLFPWYMECTKGRKNAGSEVSSLMGSAM